MQDVLMHAMKQEDLPDWRRTVVASNGTHHALDGVPLYSERFDEVLKFHAPGLAPVSRDGLAWHIDLKGQPAYVQRFLRAFGFYEGLASVMDHDGWHPIHPDGTALGEARFAWCGNFQGGLCPVRTEDGRYFHITLAGSPAYSARWRYAGDFRDGIAVVQADDGRSTHINAQGKLLHGHWFLDLDVFHKAFARARDAEGWHHIDELATPLYERRFAAVEPFYNGQARVERFDGGLEVINEDGATLVELRPAQRSEFSLLSADLVGHWKTDTIATGVKVGVFQALPGTVLEVAQRCELPPDSTRRLLRALGELRLTSLSLEGIWSATERGLYLRRDHPLTLADAALEYGGPLRRRWEDLETALREPHRQLPDIFQEVAGDSHRCAAHHRMLRSYARHDYAPLIPLLPLEHARQVVDAGGGTGELAALIAERFPHLAVVILDLPAVVAQAAPAQIGRVRTVGADLFDPWPVKPDVIVFARVLHDWDDVDAIRLLKRAREALAPEGRVLVLELVLEPSGYGGSLCDLHLLTVTGGRERTRRDFARLFEAAGFILAQDLSGPTLPHILVGVPK